ncbi:hypothetical protein CXB51_030314 [Gossypium anomalum]|uniref:NAD-dependent epimerase/dehydratase domain-containing protein n=1 Tax=Gossypium anomalum TaxID=47600 RepID=A0A8J6CJI2_9ROSI|nr:hypothetical protein CXB51_030314 [Gossypium anomalum]
MKQSEVFQLRTVEKKTGITPKEKRKGYDGEWEESATGGIGYIGSWLIEVLLQQGYSVHTTIRPDPDLSSPESFNAAMEGCRRVLHVSAPMDFQDNEPEAVLTQRSVDGALGILKSCLRSKTVKRVVHTSSISAMCFNKENVEMMDESYWTDVDYVRSELNSYSSVPSFVQRCTVALAPIFGNKDYYSLLINVATVHIDDLASAMIFLREKGDLIVPQTHFVAEIEGEKLPGLSSKKLLDFGFKFNYGAEGMNDGAIKCCREKGFL